jgi:hypothetical protein
MVSPLTGRQVHNHAVTAPSFRVLSEDEYKRLSLEERMSYMQELLANIHVKLEETRAQIERANAIINKKPE